MGAKEIASVSKIEGADNEPPTVALHERNILFGDQLFAGVKRKPLQQLKKRSYRGAGVPGGDGITTRPEGLSMGSAPSAPKTGAEPALPNIEYNIALSIHSVNMGSRRKRPRKIRCPMPVRMH